MERSIPCGVFVVLVGSSGLSGVLGPVLAQAATGPWAAARPPWPRRIPVLRSSGSPPPYLSGSLTSEDTGGELPPPLRTPARPIQNGESLPTLAMSSSLAPAPPAGGRDPV